MINFFLATDPNMHIGEARPADDFLQLARCSNLPES
jgi:hypothetical protein